jgi:non-ribosomal peptide synthetase-like protein
MKTEETQKAKFLHEYLAVQATHHPGNVALILHEWHVTYEELELRGNQWANLLIRFGLKKGDKIGLWLEKTIDLYAAIVGILKAGMCYIPLDVSFPIERVQFIVKDAGAAALITSEKLAQSIENQVVKSIILAEKLDKQLVEESGHFEATGMTPDALAYIIYTSGTTGMPKGVGISHNNVCNYVESASQLYQINASDRVYQGFSLAFDASVEEIWLAWANAATLIIPDSSLLSSGAGLKEFIISKEISVLSCVPTLLAMLEPDIPTLRLLILGGEACSAELVERWWHKKLRILNTYGPTEATIVSTADECMPGKAVTIGKPLLNYEVMILDENLKPVFNGDAGELCISGPSVANGYLNRPEMTAQKFIMHPTKTDTIIYRTGDKARINDAGDIEYMGRLDDQRKFRGFRIELAEIESHLLSMPNIKYAVTDIRTLGNDLTALIAYLVLRDPEIPIDEHAMIEKMRSELPDYMVPTIYQTIENIPTLASGKVNRKSLPMPEFHRTEINNDYIPASTSVEKSLVNYWENLFKRSPISIRHNFFHDLEGHSLFAAKLISELRKEPDMCSLSMMDIYKYPTIEALAKRVVEARNEAKLIADATKKNQQNSILLKSRFKKCAFFQGIASYVTFGFASWEFLTIFLILSYVYDEHGLLSAGFFKGLTLILLFLYPVLFTIVIAAKWIILGKIKPGRYPLWGFYYFRWWLVQRLVGSLPTQYLSGSPWMTLYLRLMGAKIGNNCYIASDAINSFDLITIGAETTVASDAHLLGYTVENGYLLIGNIAIGDRSYIGSGSVIGIHSTLQNDVIVGDNSMIHPYSAIASGVALQGSPAIIDNSLKESFSQVFSNTNERKAHSFIYNFFWGLSFYFFLVLLLGLYTCAVAPTIIVFDYLYMAGNYLAIFAIIPIASLFTILVFIAGVFILKKMTLSKIRPGIFSVNSFYYVRKWFVDRLLEFGLLNLSTLYATIYTSAWLRLLGAKIGKNTEISTLSHITPDLLTIEDESFIADGAAIGSMRVYRGHVEMANNVIGRRSFVGNSALIQAGKSIGENCLLGCLSNIPDMKPVKDNTSWFGSPAILLPRRAIFSGFTEKETFKPTKKLLLQRIVIDFMRVLTPMMIGFFLFANYFLAIYFLDAYVSIGQLFLLFPLLDMTLIIMVSLFVIALKWLFMGKFKEGAWPAWSGFVWRNEFITGLYESTIVELLLSHLVGTPFMSIVMRLLGAKIGKRVFFDSTYFTEYDLVSIGDDVAINSEATIQTHLFEDRIIKMARLKIGNECTVGALSIVLYDTDMGNNSHLGNLSLLMKGESLPENTYFAGIPAKPQQYSGTENHHPDYQFQKSFDFKFSST